MGVVYEALDTSRNSKVALKTLRDLEASALLRFKTEFRALQDLVHPNLIALDELIEEEGRWFFTMELVDGVDFLSHVRSRAVSDADSRVDPEEETMVDWSQSSVSDSLPPSDRDGNLGYDEARLRAALTQLVSGLIHLHAAHKIHRDIKPSNILVANDGRVVVLDFGLVTDHRGSDSTDANIVGTAGYMAPEQAAAKPIGPETDWYAVGVVLYEALTGRLPFDGSAIQVLMQKQMREPESPRSLVPSVPEDLDTLCVELLRFDPKKRPSGAEIARRLGIQGASRGASLAPSSLTSGVPFVGRGKELAELDRALELAKTGSAVSVYIHGESGVGKSALVDRFVATIGESAGRPVLLVRGRCYERESVPYKALDGVIDTVSRALTRMKTRDVELLLPARAALLAQVFPVLRRVEAFANAPRVSFEALDPQELRGRLFGSVRELFQNLTERARVVVIIDDLQWADADSMALLREIMRQPEAPPLLLLMTLRAAPDAGGPISQFNAGSNLLPGEVRMLPLGRLSEPEALDLAQRLIARVGPETAMTAGELAREAQGHPLFLEELARHAAQVGRSEGGGTVSRLEDALWARIEMLPASARALLSLLAVAGHPVSRDELERAAKVDEGTDVERSLSALRAGRFVRASTAGGRKGLEPFHDKIRAAVMAHVSSTDKRTSHGRLALALEASPHPDAEALAEHWRAAGEPDKGARYAEQAAEEALSAFAFDRAARLYRLVLVLKTPPELELRSLRRKLGDALANAGRGAEAAEMYLESALGATTGEALDLRRRAATHLLLSGHVEEGIATFRNVLNELGLSYPDTTAAAVRSRLVRRAWLKLRGLDFRARDPSVVSDADRVRIDVCWGVGLGLGPVDPARGGAFQTQGLLRALAAGDSYRVSRALSLEVAYVAANGAGNEKEVDRLLARAEVLASGSAHAIGMVSLARAYALYLWGRYAEVPPLAERAEHLFRERCFGAQTELDISILLSLRSLFFLGELKTLCARMPVHLREAAERGDRYALHGLRTGHLVGAWLSLDDAEGAAAELDDADRSSRDEGGFDVRKMQGWLGRATIGLYTNVTEPHYEQGRAFGASLKGTALWEIQQERVDWAWTQARLTIAMMPRAGTGSSDRVKEAHGLIRTLEKEDVPFAEPTALLLRAGVAARVGDHATAAAAADRAAALYEKLSLQAFALLAHRAAGIGSNDARGAARAVDAENALRDLGVTRPDRFASAYSPGFGE